MNSALQKYLDAASGLTNLTTAKAEQIAKGLVRSGEAASDQVGDIVDDLMDRQRTNRDAVAALVKSETNRAVRSMGFATSAEVERLQKQVADLKRELAKVSAAGGTEPAAASTGAKKTGKKTSAKKTAAKKTAKKTGAKKTGAKKTGAKKTGAKKATKTTGAKTTGAKPAGAKTAGAKTTGAKATDDS